MVLKLDTGLLRGLDLLLGRKRAEDHVRLALREVFVCAGRVVARQEQFRVLNAHAEKFREHGIVERLKSERAVDNRKRVNRERLAARKHGTLRRLRRRCGRLRGRLCSRFRCGLSRRLRGRSRRRLTRRCHFLRRRGRHITVRLIVLSACAQCAYHRDHKDHSNCFFHVFLPLFLFLHTVCSLLSFAGHCRPVTAIGSFPKFRNQFCGNGYPSYIFRCLSNTYGSLCSGSFPVSLKVIHSLYGSRSFSSAGIFSLFGSVSSEYRYGTPLCT